MEQKNPSDVVPPPYGRIFTMYDNFNYMQTSLLNDLLYTDKSVVLSAPTGSGKTVAFELAIVRMLIEADRTPSTSNDYISPKAIYIAPIKALCSEKFENWTARFDTVGIKCTQLTGDTQMTNLMAIRNAQVVISTPEKWDSLTRRWRDFDKLLSSVQLFIVDEVHLLNDDNRGPILEAIVARMKSSGVKRFLVASATIPNVEDLTSWLRSYNANVAQYIFNENQRPVPLEKHVLGINTKLKGFQFDMKLNYQIPDVIRKYAEEKATLIFCNSRKSAEMAAITLGKTNSFFQLNSQQKLYLNQLAQRLTDTKLKKLAENGIAYHHAGLQYADRHLIESSFREGYLKALFSTSTLAMGINLPAHLVIIKSTETYMCGGYVEYPENMLLQMIGRAGRPQYDTRGVVVILTQNNKVQKYKNLINGEAPIESHLHKHLTEHLNSEIALNSINNLEVAMNWIRSTYLFIRSVRNPKHYGFPADMSKDLVEHKLEELSFRQIIALESAGLVTINHVNGLNVQSTPIGKLMAKHYLSFETMKTFRDLPGNATLQNVFDLIVRSKELSEFTLRVNEKKILNALNKAPIRFPIKGRIKTNEQKISCLIQAVLGNLEITVPSMVQESLKMFRIGERVSKSLLDYVRLCVQKKIYNNSENIWFKTVLNAFIVAKCFHAKLWENSEYASKQLHGIGVVYSSLLLNAGKSTLKSIGQTDARTIEHILNKTAPFGDEVLQNLCTFPEYEIKLIKISADFIEVYAKQVNESYVHKCGSIAVLIVGDSFNNLLLLAENFDEISIEYGFFKRKVKIQNPKDVEHIYGHVVHTSLVGVDVNASLEINAPKIKSTEKTKNKTTKQIRLGATHNDTLNDSDFLPENSFNTLNNSYINKLKIFEFRKSKICHNIQRNDCSNEISTDEDINQLKIATIKPLNDISFMTDATDLNISKTSRIVQRKLTDFFVQRKKRNFITSKNTIVDLSEKTETNDSYKTIKPASNQPNNNEQQIEQSTASNRKSEISKDSTESLSSIQITCIPNISPIKRQLMPHETDFDAEFQSITKKQKFENNPNSSASYNKCPISLASFLGDVTNMKSIGCLFENEKISEENKQKQFFSPRPTEKSKENNTILGASLNKCLMPPTSFLREIQPIMLEDNKLKQRTPPTPTDESYKNYPSLVSSYNKRPMSLASFLGVMQPIMPKENKQQQCLPSRPTNKPYENNANLGTSYNISSMTLAPFPGEKEQVTHLFEKEKNSKETQQKQHYLQPTSTEESYDENIKLKPKSKTSKYENIETIKRPLDLSKNVYEHLLGYHPALPIANANNKINDLTEVSPTDEEFSLWYKVSMKFQRLPIQAMSLQNFRQVYNKVVTRENRIQKQLQKYSKTSKLQQSKTIKSLNENKYVNSINSTLEASGSSLETYNSISSESLFRLQLFIDNQNSSNNKLCRTAVNMINQNVMKRVLNEKSKFSTQAENMDLEEELTNALKDLEAGLNFAEM